MRTAPRSAADAGCASSCEAAGCPVHEADRRTLDRLSGGGAHQGVVAPLSR
ncbi:MAG: RNA methyltransferase substrate-binding domain-containing protein [Arhodomonas sp.]|nr:RNA methyltransferase substrate-binding domain-containing protein [Arhodomonas sp.]